MFFMHPPATVDDLYAALRDRPRSSKSFAILGRCPMLRGFADGGWASAIPRATNAAVLDGTNVETRARQANMQVTADRVSGGRLALPVCFEERPGKIRTMAVREILLPLNSLAAGEVLLTTAMTIARTRNAHVTALHVSSDTSDLLSLAGEGMTGAMIEDVMAATEKDNRERALAFRAMFKQSAERLEIEVRQVSPGLDHATASFVQTTGQEDDVATRRARLADLTVVPHPVAAHDVPASDTLHAVLFDSGRPVLVVPGRTGATIGTRVCLAWNGTAESAESVLSAMTWMRRASAVRILSAEGYQRRGPGAPLLAAYLALHGITADIEMFPSIQNSVGAGLLEAARRFDCDLLAMGAYSRSRLRQLILGGVTRHVLENAEIPVLMTR